MPVLRSNKSFFQPEEDKVFYGDEGKPFLDIPTVENSLPQTPQETTAEDLGNRAPSEVEQVAKPGIWRRLRRLFQPGSH